MILAGLTGGIASGKSTVCSMLRQLGAKVVDSDRIAREVVEPGQPAWKEIVEWLGAEYLLPSGGIDRKKIGALVFSSVEARHRLEEITHPRIREVVMHAAMTAAAEGAEVVVLDVPLLFEVGWDKLADEVWVVYVDRENQMERLMRRDSLSAEQAAARLDAQMSLAEKARRADVLIDNSKDLTSTRRQVSEAWRRFMTAPEN